MQIGTRPFELEYFYNRNKELETLKNNFQECWNTAIIGHRRTGKTFLCYKLISEYKSDNVIPLIVDIRENVVLGVLGLSLHILKEFFETYFTNIKIDDEYIISNLNVFPFDTDYNNKLKLKTNDILVNSVVDFFTKNYNNKDISPYIFLNNVFDFINKFAAKHNLKVMFILDEFQDILRLEKLNDKINDSAVLGFFAGKIEKLTNIWFCLTGSLINMMEKIINDYDAALYGRLNQIRLEPFSVQTATEFIFDILKTTDISGEALKQIISLSNGIPYYIVRICQDFSISKKDNLITIDNINESIVYQITNGDLHSHCQKIFETVKQFIDFSKIYELLEFIAGAEKIKISDINNIFQTNIKKVLDKLRDISIIEYDTINTSKFVFLIDTIFMLWLQSRSENPQNFINNVRKRLKRNLEKENLKLKSELGKAIEYQYIHYLKQKAGKKISDVILPHFDSLENKNYFDEEGTVFKKPSNIEIDALGLGKQNWLFEFKNTENYVTEKNIEKLIRIKQFLIEKHQINIDKICFISLSGYKETVYSKYKTNEVILLHKKDFF